MVNIPPIPPLLCSTPPPIDFGEDDEDLDSMPPSLDDVEDDFGGYLVGDSIKTHEALPSPRPPSACDLPSISIYDGMIPSSEGEEELSRYTKTSALQSPEARNIKKNVTEAFNYQVKSCAKEEKLELPTTTVSPATQNGTVEHEQQGTVTENVTAKLQVEEQVVCSGVIEHTFNTGLSKNMKELKIEPVTDERKSIINKSNEDCVQNVVSIEDLEDDLSDDEVYSPKTPKNFTEFDNMTDFFKIEEINVLTDAENPLQPDSKIIVSSKPSESKDNNKSASPDSNNDIEFKSFSSRSFIQNQYDEPPPLSEDFNSTVSDVDDDFGDYADFQETHFVNNAVPVENVYSNQHKRDLEINNVNALTSHNIAVDSSNVENVQIDANKTEHVQMKAVEMSEYLKNAPFDNFSLTDKFTMEEGGETVAKNVDLPASTQQSITDTVGSLCAADEICNDHKNDTAENENQPVKHSSHEDNSLSEMSEAAGSEDDEDFGNFAEFSSLPPDYENTTVKTKAANFSNDDDNEYSDFADFESHQTVTKSEESHQDDVNSDEKDDDDDDDFGDFNTADPSATTPSSIVTSASQNVNSQTPITASKNLNERISKILQLMFNPSLNLSAEDSDELKADKIQDIPFTSIDAAKALEYQWLNSDTRHSFIRSLGIDSRNILYGDNWNPSLPRFAANLSFNPLKPMKPVPPANVTESTLSVLEPIPVASTETNRTIEMSGGSKKEQLDLDWKTSITEEQTIEAFKGDNIHAPIDAATSLPYISNESQTAPQTESLTIFENTFDNEGKLSKTPPISEMESVTSFASPLPVVAMQVELSTPQTELEENASSPDISEVVVTSTFTGSFKETHIYTPPKANDFDIKHVMQSTTPTCSSSPTKSSPIDFDYEKAAMGVIIDETVVKKEYRDVEYNPPFSMDSLSKSVSPKMEFLEANNYINKNLTNLSLADNKIVSRRDEDEDTSDDFSEFQSVASEVAMPPTSKPLEVPKNTTVSHGGMILSPAILIPQAISMENQKPKIEWGDSTATINPEELARIEELFPEPKSINKSSSSSQKSTPTHQVASAPSISATVANKELEGNISNVNDDDDDWSDFVSVTVTNNISANRTGSNNNVLTRSPASTPFQQRSPIVTNKIPPPTSSNSNNDDEWSDFVSSAPPVQQPNAYRVPQFNSGAWQNANFYNNPLSMYHKGPLNIPTTAAATHSAQKYSYNNNNNNYPMANNMVSSGMANNHQAPHNCYKQQVHVMQNFSTAPVPTPDRLTAAAARNNQFQSIGSAKVAPSIALIPDLGFVAPAIPTHTSFINSLPKPSINMKK